MPVCATLSVAGLIPEGREEKGIKFSLFLVLSEAR